MKTVHVGKLELRFHQTGHETAGALDVFEMIAPPDGEMPIPHYHRDWDETVIGLEGTTTFIVEGQPHDIGPGRSLFIPRGKVHGFENRSGAVARSLGILTPGKISPDYFEELGAEVDGAAGKPDPSRMEAIMRRWGLIPAGT